MSKLWWGWFPPGIMKGMLISLFHAGLAYGAIAWLSLIIESITRKKLIHSHELSRKLIHIGTGLWMASWPLFFGERAIILACLGLLFSIIVSRHFRLFTSVHSVHRRTLGEYWLVIAVIALTLLNIDNWIYAVSIAHVSLADSVAALVGERFGHNSQYVIFGSVKSIAGSLAFMAVSLLIMVFATFARDPSGLTFWVGVPAAAVLCEAFGPYGSDNLLLPLGVAAMLSL